MSRKIRVAKEIQAVIDDPTPGSPVENAEALAVRYSGKYMKWVNPPPHYQEVGEQPMYIQKIKPANTVWVMPTGEARTISTRTFDREVGQGNLVLTQAPEQELERATKLQDMKQYWDKEFRLTDSATSRQRKNWSPEFKIMKIMSSSLVIKTGYGTTKTISLSTFLNALENGHIELSPYQGYL